MMDTSIFNKENAIVYGDIDAEGFLQEDQKQFGCKIIEAWKMRIMVWHSCFIVWAMPSEFFPAEETVVCLGIAAVFYSECAVDDEEKIMRWLYFPVNSTVLQNTPQLYLKKWMQS